MKSKYKYNPFKTPEDYFEALSDKVMKRLSEEGKVARDTKEATGFTVPQGYFEGLGESIRHQLEVPNTGSGLQESEGVKASDTKAGQMESAKQEEPKIKEAKAPYIEAGQSDHTGPGKTPNQEAKTIPLHPYKKYFYAAASIAAVFLLVFVFNRNSSPELSFDDLAATEIEGYFEENSLDLSSYEIAELVPVDELEINDVLTNGFEEDILLEYLDNNTDTYEELRLDDNE